MKITFLGGAETVTGSKFLVEAGGKRVLVDCGLFQGYKYLRERNRETPHFDIESLDAVILTHAHLDHSGYIPLLYKKGYRGPIYTHHASRALCGILLPDSGHIQEQDAKYFAKHRISKHAHPAALYTRAEAEKCMELFEPVDFDEMVQIGDISFSLQSAGHILGAASIIMHAEDKTIGFSGDVGRPDDVLMREPRKLPHLDLLLLESTYGNRQHERDNPTVQLAKIVTGIAEQGGVLLIPSFAVGRAQTIMHLLAELKKADQIPDIPVFLDSPMAINVSDIYCRYADQHRLSTEQCEEMCAVATYVNDVEESKALAELTYPHIIIAGSGMATGGRILHHMKRLLGDYRTTLLFTGYQAGGTRGAKMQQGAESVKIHGKWLPVKAKVEVLSGLSGHGDYLDMSGWLAKSELNNKTRIKLIHGEPESLESFRDYLDQTTDFDVEIAGYRKILTI